MLIVLMPMFGVLLFIPFILMAGRNAESDKRMMARFAMLQPGRGLSTSVSDDLLKHMAVGSSGWLEPAFARLEAAMQLNLLIRQANVRATARRLLLLSLALSMGAMLLTYMVIHVAAVALVAGAAGYIPIIVLKFQRNHRVTMMDKALPDMIDIMSRALRAGHSVAAAISIIAEQAEEPARTEFSEVFRKQKFGLSMRDALLELLDRVPSQDLRVLVTGILVQRDTGGNLTQILDRTSAVIRERLKLQGDIRVHTAQGRMTGWILCLLPVIMLVLINLINPGYSKPLTDDPLGRKCLYTGCVLLALGAFLIKRIVSKIEV